MVAGSGPWHYTHQYREWTSEVSSALSRWVHKRRLEVDEMRWRSSGQYCDLALVEICESQARYYQAMQREITARDFAAIEEERATYAEWWAAYRYARHRAALWEDVLDWARHGTLMSDWRQRLPAYSASVAARFGGRDASEHTNDTLALHEIAGVGPQVWEPHVAGDWRIALDGWHRAQICVHDARVREHLEFTPAEPRIFHGHSVPTVRFGDAWAVIAPRKLDRNEAWYRAGLAGGGAADSGEWIDWYRTRITETWDRSDDAAHGITGRFSVDKALGELENPAFLQDMCAIPAYWSAPSRRAG